MPDSPVLEVVHLNKSDFRKSMQALVKRGGAHSRAAREASRIIGSLTSGMEELNRLTQYGESRIQSCQKYDLTEGFRLVTVRTEGLDFIVVSY